MQSIWRTVQRFLKKLKIELPYNPAIPFLGIYSEKTITQKNICTPVFTGVLVTVTKMKSTYMSIHRSMDKADVVHIYSGMLFSHKKDQNSAIYSNVDGPRDYGKWSKSERKRQIPCVITHVESNFFKWYKWTYLQNRNRLIDFRSKLNSYQRGHVGRDLLEAWN